VTITQRKKKPMSRPFGRSMACAGVTGLLALATATINGQSGAKNGEWRSYGADTGSTHYSPLDQISAANFGKLELAWRFKTDSLGPRPEYQYEGTPLMANGVLYATAGSRRAVVALNPDTGEMLWMHSEQEGQRGAVAPRQLSGRGLSYWTDGREARILYVTPGYRLIALDAKTGVPIPTFGSKGAVDLKLEDDQTIEPLNDEIGLHAAPLVARNVVIVGAAHKTGANPKSKRNVKGFVRGFDVRTGKRLWIFHTVPPPGEFGNDTWQKDSWSYTGNTGVWGQISADEELGLVYLPVELPTGDFYGGDRPGAGLFGESIVAVDLQTGAGAPRHLGHGHPVRADPRRRHHERPHDQSAGAADEAGVPVRVQSGNRRAHLANRGAARREGRCTGRVVFADAAVSHEAAGVRPSEHVH
jgi:quinoprotein glucose dehydrogenase